MSTHNIGFYEDLTKNILNYPQISSNTHLISSAAEPPLSVLLVSVCSNIDCAHDDPNVFVPLTRVLGPLVTGLLRTLI